MADRIRLTVTVTSEVHETFTRIAKASGVSLGRTMGDWLADTLDGAQFVAVQMEKAKQAPVTVMREMQAMLNGAHGEASLVLENLRSGRAAQAAASPAAVARGDAAAVAARAAPSSNTGRKYPPRGQTGRGKP
jgi:hypothetical protein